MRAKDGSWGFGVDERVLFARLQKRGGGEGTLGKKLVKKKVRYRHTKRKLGREHVELIDGKNKEPINTQAKGRKKKKDYSRRGTRREPGKFMVDPRKIRKENDQESFSEEKRELQT